MFEDQDAVAWTAMPYRARVVTADGEEIGTAESLLGDEEEDIFHGIAVRRRAGAWRRSRPSGSSESPSREWPPISTRPRCRSCRPIEKRGGTGSSGEASSASTRSGESAAARRLGGSVQRWAKASFAATARNATANVLRIQVIRAGRLTIFSRAIPAGPTTDPASWSTTLTTSAM